MTTVSRQKKRNEPIIPRENEDELINPSNREKNLAHLSFRITPRLIGGKLPTVKA